MWSGLDWGFSTTFINMAILAPFTFDLISQNFPEFNQNRIYKVVMEEFTVNYQICTEHQDFSMKISKFWISK